MTRQPATESSVSTFRLELFWALYKQKIIIGTIIVLVALLGGGAFFGFQMIQAQKAAAAYASADSVDAWRSAISQFPSSIAAGNSYLRIANQLQIEGKYPDSNTAYETFVHQFPKHPLVVSGYIGLASNAELEKDTTKALHYYKQITDQYGTSYEAPMALYHQGRLIKAAAQAKDQPKETVLSNLQQARALFEAVVNRYPDSIAAELAGTEASRLAEELTQGAPDPVALPAPALSASPATSASSSPPQMLQP